MGTRQKVKEKHTTKGLFCKPSDDVRQCRVERFSVMQGGLV